MIELQSTAEATESLATAPGYLPQSEIAARVASQRTQFRHDNTTVPLAPAPGEPVEVWAANGDLLPLSRATLYYSTDGATPDAASAALPMSPQALDWDVQAGYLTRWRAAIPPQPAGAIVRYRIGGWRTETDTAATETPELWANDGQGFWFRYPGERGVTTFAYRVEPPDPGLPVWASDAVIYQIFLDRFHPGNDDGSFPPNADPLSLHGGTLRGVARALPYLQDLGITCLWLSPVCAAESYHRYDATDYFTVDPRVGTNEDLRTLTDAAHARGMRVILDFVPSHCSWHHPAFLEAQRDRSAPTARWFTFEDWPHTYRNFIGHAPQLPSINTDDPGARAYLIDSAVHWIRDYGIDGLRLDHAIGPSMDFWVALREATRAVLPDVFTVGEVTDTPDCLRRYRHRLDAVLDFSLTRALWLTFGRDEMPVAAFDSFLNANKRFMAEGPSRVSFLDSHDMNRFLFVAGNDIARLKMAALCQFTLEPTPTIYYGTEIGMTQQLDFAEAGYGGDAQARADMIWNPSHWNHDLLGFYRDLIRLRRSSPALLHGARRTVHLDTATGTYAYQRELPSGGAVLAAFNCSAVERTIPLPNAGGSPDYSVLMSTGTASRTSAGLMLAPRSAAVLG